MIILNDNENIILNNKQRKILVSNVKPNKTGNKKKSRKKRKYVTLSSKSKKHHYLSNSASIHSYNFLLHKCQDKSKKEVFALYVFRIRHESQCHEQEYLAVYNDYIVIFRDLDSSIILKPQKSLQRSEFLRYSCTNIEVLPVISSYFSFLLKGEQNIDSFISQYFSAADWRVIFGGYYIGGQYTDFSINIYISENSSSVFLVIKKDKDNKAIALSTQLYREPFFDSTLIKREKFRDFFIKKHLEAFYKIRQNNVFYILPMQIRGFTGTDAILLSDSIKYSIKNDIIYTYYYDDILKNVWLDWHIIVNYYCFLGKCMSAQLVVEAVSGYSTSILRVVEHDYVRSKVIETIENIKAIRGFEVTEKITIASLYSTAYPLVSCFYKNNNGQWKVSGKSKALYTHCHKLTLGKITALSLPQKSYAFTFITKDGRRRIDAERCIALFDKHKFLSLGFISNNILNFANENFDIKVSEHYKYAFVADCQNNQIVNNDIIRCYNYHVELFWDNVKHLKITIELLSIGENMNFIVPTKEYTYCFDFEDNTRIQSVNIHVDDALYYGSEPIITIDNNEQIVIKIEGSAYRILGAAD